MIKRWIRSLIKPGGAVPYIDIASAEFAIAAISKDERYRPTGVRVKFFDDLAETAKHKPGR
jgi:hypothetical protein